MELLNQAINMILVSIPEEMYITIVILIMLKEEKFLLKEHAKENMIKIMLISVIPMALISNSMEYISTVTGIETIKTIKNFMGLLLTPITIMLIVDYKNKIAKIIIYTFIAFISLAFLEIGTLGGIIYGLNVDILLVNKSPYMNFVLSIPERLIQFSFIYYKFIRKNSLKDDLKNLDIFRMAMENSNVKKIFITTTLGSLIVLSILTKFVFIDGVMKQYSTNSQLFIVIMILGTIIFFNSALWFLTISIYQKEKYIQETIEEGYHEKGNI